MRDLKKAKALLNQIDEELRKDPRYFEEEEKYKKKYGSIDEKDLYKPFTI